MDSDSILVQTEFNFIKIIRYYQLIDLPIYKISIFTYLYATQRIFFNLFLINILSGNINTFKGSKDQRLYVRICLSIISPILMLSAVSAMLSKVFLTFPLK